MAGEFKIKTGLLLGAAPTQSVTSIKDTSISITTDASSILVTGKAIYDFVESELSGISVETSIGGLTDTSLNDPSVGDLLVYDGTVWYNRPDFWALDNSTLEGYGLLTPRDPSHALYLSDIELSGDNGPVTFINMSVTSEASDGSIASYGFNMDDIEVARIYAESDGVGSVDNIKFQSLENFEALSDVYMTGISNVGTGYMLSYNPTTGQVYYADASAAGTTAEWGGITGTLSDQTDLYNPWLVDLSTRITSASAGATWGSITGTLSDQTDLNTYLTDLSTNKFDKSGGYISGDVSIDGSLHLSDGLWLGDGDTGIIFEALDDRLIFQAGTTSFNLNNVGTPKGFYSNVGGNMLASVNSTSTIPGITFQDDADTGIGRAGDNQLSLIAASVEGIRIWDSSVTLYHKTDLQSNKIINLGTPTDSSDAANKWYSDQPWVDINRTGFLNQTDTNLLFNETTAVFTLQDAGSGWDYYYDGIKYSFTGDVSVPLPNGADSSAGTYYITFETSLGELSVSDTAWSLDGDSNTVLVAFVDWDASLSPKYWMGEERHTALIDRRMHRYLHETRGSQFVTGAVLDGPTVGATTDASNAFGVSATEIADEDIFQILDELVRPVSPFEEYVVWYRDAGEWKWNRGPAAILENEGTGLAQYDDGGDMVDVSTGWYVNTYLMLTNLNGEARFSILVGQGQYETLNGAIDENPAQFDFTGMPIAEYVIAYQFTWEVSAGLVGTTTGAISLASEPKRIEVNSTSASAITSESHNDLLAIQGGNGADEYYHLTESQFNDFVGKTYVDGSLNSKYDKAGGTITGNVDITGTTTVAGDVSISSNVFVADGSITVTNGNVDITGDLTATTKSFVIDHPTKKNAKLKYGNLEGPEHGVYHRGRITDTDTIELPEYWSELTREESVSVHLTPIGKPDILYVKAVEKNKVIVGKKGRGTIDCYYTVYGERKDIDKLKTEIYK